jgi:hypothetical protein
MRRRSLVAFVILNVFISLGVAFAVISALSPQSQGSPERIVITVPILVTATPDPNVTRSVVIVTATPLPGTPQSVAGLIPTGLFGQQAGDSTSPAGTAVDVPTIDPVLLEADAELQQTVTALPQGCIPHTVAEGETPYGIAEQYGADGFEVLEVNGLDEVTAGFLQIGDVLIIPLDGCTLTAADVQAQQAESASPDEVTALDEIAETEEATAEPSATATSTQRPTVTLAPTSTSASVTIRSITNVGDVTTEGIEIHNTGSTINIAGWTLTDAEGNQYTFSEQFMFPNASITVYTRAGQDTQILRYWGRDDAVLAEGDVVTLQDNQGRVQSTYRIE